MKKAVLLILFIFSCVVAFAQTHNYRSCCRYFKAVKGSAMAECVCPACDKDKKDEIKAAQEERKQLIEKGKAEQAIKDAADKKAREEAEKKREREKTTVYIESPVQKQPSKSLDQAKNVTSKTSMTPVKDGGDMYFTDSAKNILFFVSKNYQYQPGFERNKSNPFISTFHCYYAYLERFPRHLGLFYNGYSTDIVYPNGKREFNNDSISRIHYVLDNWFLIQNQPQEQITYGYVYLFNLATKQRIKLPQPTNYYISGIERYTPIYKEEICNLPNSIQGGCISGRGMDEKLLLLKYFPDRVNEKLLSENLFCIKIGYLSNNNPNDIIASKFEIVYITKGGKLFYK